MNTEPKLTHAAIRTHIGVYAVLEPGTHYDVINLAYREGHPMPVKGEYGFLQNGAKFVTCVDAVKVAYNCGQLLWTPQDPAYKLLPSDIWSTEPVTVDNM